MYCFPHNSLAGGGSLKRAFKRQTAGNSITRARKKQRTCNKSATRRPTIEVGELVWSPGRAFVSHVSTPRWSGNGRSRAVPSELSRPSAGPLQPCAGRWLPSSLHGGVHSENKSLRSKSQLEPRGICLADLRQSSNHSHQAGRMTSSVSCADVLMLFLFFFESHLRPSMNWILTQLFPTINSNNCFKAETAP